MNTREAQHRHDRLVAGYWSRGFRQGAPYFLVPDRSRSDRALLSACFPSSEHSLSNRQMLQLPELLSSCPGSFSATGVPSWISLAYGRSSSLPFYEDGWPVDNLSNRTALSLS